MENKMTKVQKFELIKELCADNEIVVAFCEDEIAALNKKAEKAKVRAAEKRAAGDELYAAVLECVGTEPITAEAVLALFENADGELTVAKVRARLSQGVQNGVLNKAPVKVDGKDKMHYTKA
jgi:hypothetical protein